LEWLLSWTTPGGSPSFARLPAGYADSLERQCPRRRARESVGTGKRRARGSIPAEGQATRESRSLMWDAPRLILLKRRVAFRNNQRFLGYRTPPELQTCSPRCNRPPRANPNPERAEDRPP